MKKDSINEDYIILTSSGVKKEINSQVMNVINYITTSYSVINIESSRGEHLAKKLLWPTKLPIIVRNNKIDDCYEVVDEKNFKGGK